MEKSVEGGSAEEACRAATIGASLKQGCSEIEAQSSDAPAHVGYDTLARHPNRPGLLPSGSNRF